MPTKKPTQATRWIIRGANGTYFREFVAIGPRFGGTKSQAQRFDAKHEAHGAMARHFGMMGSEIVEIQEAP